MTSRALAASLALLAIGFGATFIAGPWKDERVNDLFVYRQAAEPLLDGRLPYREVFLEYPPLAAPVIALPAIVGTDEHDYRAAFAVQSFVLAAVLVMLCGALARRTGGDPRLAMLGAAAAPVLCGAMIRTHFDLAPVVLTVAALLLLSTGRARLGMGLLGLGAMTKGFPLVAAPAALAWLAAQQGRRAVLGGAVALAVALAIPALVAIAISPQGTLDALRYQVDRPVQVESSPAQALRLLDGLGLGRARSVNNHRSDGLEHPASAAVSATFVVLLLAVLALLAFAAARGDPPSERRLVLAALASVVAFAALGRVLSPQFLVWVVPLMALALSWGDRLIAFTAAAAIVFTLAEFPSRYFELVDRKPFAVAVVVARDLLLLGVVGIAAHRLSATWWRASSPAAAAARST